MTRRVEPRVELWWVERGGDDEEVYVWVRQYPTGEVHEHCADRLWRLFEALRAERDAEIESGLVRCLDGMVIVRTNVLVMPAYTKLERYVDTVALAFDL